MAVSCLVYYYTCMHHSFFIQFFCFLQVMSVSAALVPRSMERITFPIFFDKCQFKDKL